jgi:RHS repeat-associated protein
VRGPQRRRDGQQLRHQPVHGPAEHRWDGENRLTGVSPARTPETGDLKIEFQYDYLGRRVEKVVYDADGNGGWEVTPTEVRRFMYDDWRMVLELDDEGYVLRQYTWGLDLSGTRGGAGGIGGLLGVYDAGEEDEYIYFHDAQGNVGQVVGWVDDFGGASGSAWDASRLVATYEYAPYGEILASSGDFAAVNPFRFSTKYHDDETGLIDFGRRLYDRLLGRWINRDPIEEEGGVNLYVYVVNSPCCYFDAIGEACSGWAATGSAYAKCTKAVRLSGGGVQCQWSTCQTRTRTCTTWWCFTKTETLELCNTPIPMATTTLPAPAPGPTGPGTISIQTYCNTFGVGPGGVTPMPGGQPPDGLPPAPPVGSWPP